MREKRNSAGRHAAGSGHPSTQAPTLAGIARALGGEVHGREFLAPGPGHSAKDRSLSVTLSPTAPDGFLIHSFAGDDWRDCRDHVCERLGLLPFAPSRNDKHRRVDARPRPVAPAVRKDDDPEEPEDDAWRVKNALRLWTEAADPRGTLAHVYLEYRKLDLSDEAAGTVIRFHPSCWFGKERHPAMVCLVRGIVSNKPQAVHRTALSPDGITIKRDGRTFRMSLGPIAGGAIKIDPDEDVTQGLCIGEGVETCLAGQQMGLRPVWCAISTAGIASFPILPGIEGLHVLRENDTNLAGPKCVEDCPGRWRAAGRDVRVVDSEHGSDLNDELTGALP